MEDISVANGVKVLTDVNGTNDVYGVKVLTDVNGAKAFDGLDGLDGLKLPSASVRCSSDFEILTL